MYIIETSTCCSLLELGGFGNYYPVSKKEILQEIKNYLENYHFNPNYSIPDIDYPKTILATTKSDQTQAEIALKELKFKPTKFKSRHPIDSNEKVLTLWVRTSMPTELRSWLRYQEKKIKKEQTL